MSPAVYWVARCVSRAVSAMESLMAAMPGGQGCAPWSGTGASPRGMCRSASLMRPSSGVMRPWSVVWLLGALAGSGSGSLDAAGEGAADGGGAQLGEGG